MEMLYLVLLATVTVSDVAEPAEERYFRQRSLTLALETNLKEAATADLRKGRQGVSNKSEGGGGGDYRSAEAAIGLVVVLLP
ncbi:hypothetical protein ACSBR2_000768 [Camellia fascicularis]